MRVRVQHDIDDLANDLAGIARTTRPKMARVVKRNTEQGNRLAQRFAREMSGPHGLHYWKRISDEMVDPLTGEYGPHAGGTPVGGGYRNGPPNTDLPRSADIQGPQFAKDMRDLLDGAFW